MFNELNELVSDEFDEHYDFSHGQLIKTLNLEIGSTKIPRFQCACHKLNLAVRHAIKHHEPTKLLLRKLNSWCVTVRNAIALNKLFVECHVRLRLDNSLTRWSSAFLMVEAVHRAYKAKIIDGVNVVCPVDLETIEILLQILRPAYQCSIALQSYNASICEVLHGIARLIYIWKHLAVTNVRKEFCQALVKYIEKKFAFELSSPIYKVILLKVFFVIFLGRKNL
jgi:hypothetical protein